MPDYSTVQPSAAVASRKSWETTNTSQVSYNLFVWTHKQIIFGIMTLFDDNNKNAGVRCGHIDDTDDASRPASCGMWSTQGGCVVDTANCSQKRHKSDKNCQKSRLKSWAKQGDDALPPAVAVVLMQAEFCRVSVFALFPPWYQIFSVQINASKSPSTSIRSLCRVFYP